MTSNETLAVLGAGGTMGHPMARNLARAGLAVRAWNRTTEKARPLAEHGVEVCETPAAAVRGATAILTMLDDADSVLEVVGDARDAIGDGAIWLQMSTIGIAGIERCAALAEDAGLTLVDAPVLGTKAPAEQGALTVLAAGADDLRDRLAPIFDVVGQRTLWLGEVGTGTRMKLVLNAWVVSLVEGAAETLALAEGLDLDPAQVLAAVAGGPLDLPYLQLKGKMMIERSFDPSFRLALAAKDAALVQDAAQHAGVELPMLRAISDQLAAGAERHGDEDLAATFLSVAR